MHPRGALPFVWIFGRRIGPRGAILAVRSVQGAAALPRFRILSTGPARPARPRGNTAPYKTSPPGENPSSASLTPCLSPIPASRSRRRRRSLAGPSRSCRRCHAGKLQRTTQGSCRGGSGRAAPTPSPGQARRRRAPMRAAQPAACHHQKERMAAAASLVPAPSSSALVPRSVGCSGSPPCRPPDHGRLGKGGCSSLELSFDPPLALLLHHGFPSKQQIFC